MGEVVTVETRPQLSVGSRPSAIVPTTMDEAYRLGKAICMAGMAPRGMDSPEKCMIAIMRGMEVGLTPMMALDKIAIVNGRPVIWGDGAIGLVRGSGLCEWVKERVEGTGDARQAICETKRRGEPDAIIRTFSVADAKKASLWGKQGPWQQFPDRMLQMRARAFALRDGFADVLGGLYLKEELDDAEPFNRREQPTPPVPPVPQIEEKAKEPPMPPAGSAIVCNRKTGTATVIETPIPPVPPTSEKPIAVPLPDVYRAALADVNDGDAMDAAWREFVEPHLNDMPKEVYEELMAIEDEARARIEG